MSEIFRKDTYYHAFKDETGLFAEPFVLMYVKQAVQFEHPQVDYNAFLKKYKDDGESLQRWIISLPSVVMSGLIYPIVHIAEGIFFGIPRVLNGNPHYLLAKKYSVIRDFQEAAGWLLLFSRCFDESYCLYQIEKSRFHISCYNCFAETKGPIPKASRTSSSFKKSSKTPSPPKTKSTFKSTNPPPATFSETSTRSYSTTTCPKTTTEFSKPGTFDEEIKIIHQAKLDRENKKKAYMNLANNYFKYCEYENSIKVLNKILWSSKEKNTLLLKIAEAYINKGDKKDALKILNSVFSQKEDREKLLLKIANDYYCEGDRNEALKVLGYVYSDRENKSNLNYKIAKSYLNEGDLIVAFDLTKKLDMHDPNKYELFEIIATKYYKKGEYGNCYEAVSNMFYKKEQKNHFLQMLLGACMRVSDEETFTLIVKNLILESYLEKLTREQNTTSFLSNLDSKRKRKEDKALRNKLLKNRSSPFLLKVQNECSRNAKARIRSGNAEGALKGIKEEAVNERNWGEFLRL